MAEQYEAKVLQKAFNSAIKCLWLFLLYADSPSHFQDLMELFWRKLHYLP